MARIVAFILLLAHSAPAEEIPLKSIWALDMPGTRDVRKLENIEFAKLSNQEAHRASLVRQITTALLHRPADGRKVGPGFVVEGIGKDALKNARDVLVEKNREDSERMLPADVDLSLVFYAFNSGRYVHVTSVDRTDTVYHVKYDTLPHTTTETTTHFAIIPIGKPPIGSYHVKFTEVPRRDTTTMPNRHRVVCESFSFSVGK